jgi:hypothetical protein
MVWRVKSRETWPSNFEYCLKYVVHECKSSLLLVPPGMSSLLLSYSVPVFQHSRDANAASTETNHQESLIQHVMRSTWY